MYALTLVAAVALATSCEKEKEPGNENPVDNAIQFVDGYISFYGTDYSETNNFNIVLYTDMFFHQHHISLKYYILEPLQFLDLDTIS